MLGTLLKIQLPYKNSFVILKVCLVCIVFFLQIKSIFFKSKETVYFQRRIINTYIAKHTWVIYVLIALQMGEIMSYLAFLFSCNQISKIFNYTKVSFEFPHQIFKYENANLGAKSTKCEPRGYHIQKCIQTTFSRNRNLTSYM